jgi:hypothetical protein
LVNALVAALYPYQVLERRPAQETLTGCAELHNINNLKALNIHPVYGIDKRKIHFTYVLYVGRAHGYFNLIMLQIRNAKLGMGYRGAKRSLSHGLQIRGIMNTKWDLMTSFPLRILIFVMLNSFCHILNT